jgi:hypothetical protein
MIKIKFGVYSLRDFINEIQRSAFNKEDVEERSAIIRRLYRVMEVDPTVIISGITSLTANNIDPHLNYIFVCQIDNGSSYCIHLIEQDFQGFIHSIIYGTEFKRLFLLETRKETFKSINRSNY